MRRNVFSEEEARHIRLEGMRVMRAVTSVLPFVTLGGRGANRLCPGTYRRSRTGGRRCYCQVAQMESKDQGPIGFPSDPQVGSSPRRMPRFFGWFYGACDRSFPGASARRSPEHSSPQHGSTYSLGDDGPNITDRLAADESASQALLVLVMVAVAVPLARVPLPGLRLPSPEQLARDSAGGNCGRGALP